MTQSWTARPRTTTTPAPTLLYTVYRQQGQLVGTFRAHWADFDQTGDLVATAGGRHLRATIPRQQGQIRWTEVASLA